MQQLTAQHKSQFNLQSWAAEPGGLGGCSPPVFAKFSQNLPFLPQILAFLCPQPPHVPVSPRAFKFTPPSVTVLPNGPWEKVAMGYYGHLKTGEYISVVIDEHS